MNKASNGIPDKGSEVKYRKANLRKQGSAQSGGILKYFNIFNSQPTLAEERPSEEDEDVPLSQEKPTVDQSPKLTPKIEDVAVPRADVISVPDTISLPELVEVFKTSERTRLPVFHETLDNPLGFVHLKDIAIKYGFNGSHEDFKVTGELHKLLFVPPSMDIDTLRRDMQEKRCHMALVIDEYGGVDGLVTIEDLLEHYFGEIIDEHDTQEENEQEIVRTDDDNFLCMAKVELEDLKKVTGLNLTLDLDEDEIDTLGGWVSSKINRIPEPGDIFQFPDQGLWVKVIKGDARKMDLLSVNIIPKKGEDQEKPLE